MINQLIKEVEGVFGLSTPARRRKARTAAKTRTYRAPARRTAAKKRKAKRITRRRY